MGLFSRFWLEAVTPRPAAGPHGRAQGKTDDIVTVAWADAMRIAADMIEQLPYLFPPRFRALGFLAADARTKLKAVAQRL
jgi:hypothetical protein